MFGVDIFNYNGGGTYIPPTIAMKADWADYVVDMPTAYENCISDEGFGDGWSETLKVGDNLIPEDKQNMKAISIPEGYVASLYPPTADGVAETASQEITGPTNSDTFGECIEVSDNTLLYAGIGGAALLLLIVVLK